MADRYLRLTASNPGRFVARRLGLPLPTALRRFTEQTPDLPGPVLRLTAGEVPAPGAEPYGGVVVDAAGIGGPAALAGLHTTLHPLVRSLAPCGRIVVLGARPADGGPEHAAAQQAVEGFTRSLGKEAGRGVTVNLLRLAPGADPEAALGFLLSPRSAYVSGQVVEVGPAPGGVPEGPRTALVTGAARGIGAAVAETLARDGARVVLLDVPRAGDALAAAADRLGGQPLPLDVTAPDAGDRIAAALPATGLDVLVHNAGITRDRRLANMAADRWDAVLDVNLGAVLRTTQALLKAGAVNDHARVVGTSSIAGIAGNVGQTNYAASKAGIIGWIRALAADEELRGRGVTANAVAPGFIETAMTAAIPLVVREAGRRMNSLGQGGRPQDVAETVAWLAGAASGGVNGQVVRVCGQSLLGA
jgi:3-oxoacyl-[acyl-carrier protein] reductase